MQVVVPLTPSMNQSFSITLPINNSNVTLSFEFTYNTPGGYWYMSITDASGNLLLDAIPLVTGNYPSGDLLRQYQYLGIGSAYVVPVTTGLAEIPSFSEFGSDFLLVWSG